jgi:hypothetical protein
MYNVSVRNKLLFNFFMGVLIVPFVLIMNAVLSYDTEVALILISPVWLFMFWSEVIINLNNADISINEKNDLIVIKNVFKERYILLNELEIKEHKVILTRLAFIFYTNSEKIILNYTKNNYDTIIEILNLIKYKNIDQFIGEVSKRTFFHDLR